METKKYSDLSNNGPNYGVQYIDVTNNPMFVGIETGFVSPQSVKLRRSIDLSNVCEKNREGVLAGTEFTAAELNAILSENSNDNKTLEPLEVSTVNSKIDLITTSSNEIQQFAIEENVMSENKQLIDLNTPVYFEVSEANEEGIIIETDIAGTIEIGTESLITNNNVPEGGESSSYINQQNITPKETKKVKISDESTQNGNENNNETIPDDELKLIESLTNKQENKSQDLMNTMKEYNQSKNHEILKAAKSLYSKRTRTLWHWIDPKIPKTKLKNIVLIAWDGLPAWQKQIYISQVLGKFSMDVVTPMINPQLAGIATTSTPNTESTPQQTNVAKKRMYIHKPSQKWDYCFKSKKKRSNGISSQNLSH
ncbi:hypothetical protein O3M35_009585 [Rhynocoris fuscipes]|uniref:Uncharacterized protein n=1 Tax=Rhynocoris fuscipes TaxID=488301 RepID=A0AAW1D3H3_9HEMI